MLSDRTLLASTIARRYDIWHLEFLDARAFASFCSDRGVQVQEQMIRHLWSVGMLRADIVRSPHPVSAAGLVEVQPDTPDPDERLYADARSIPEFPSGLMGATSVLGEIENTVEPLFHPFRLLVASHLQRVLQIPISDFQAIYPREAYPRLLGRILDMFQRATSSDAVRSGIEAVNARAALAILVEPCVSAAVFERTIIRGFYDEVSFPAALTDHWREIEPTLRQIAVADLEAAQRALCIDADRRDSNHDIHVVIRLMKPESRTRLKGELGAAVLFRAMAETIRRATERVHGITLREEDELGFGTMLPGVKQQVYGNERLLDTQRPRQEFLRQHELDYGIRLRVYVEGETEQGAIENVLDWAPSEQVQLINLRGRVAERGVPAFMRSLSDDLRAGLFSIVLVDGDRSDYVSAVSGAARQDAFCGEFLVSVPDFEFAHLSRNELEDVIWAIIVDSHPQERSVLHDLVQNANTGEELLRESRRAFPDRSDVLRKGTAWGRRLMDFILNNPNDARGNERRIIGVVRSVVNANSYNFASTRQRYRTDPLTGRLVERSTSVI